MVIKLFTGYKINKGVLYLYLDYRYEIANFNDNTNNQNIIEKAKKYIKERRIKYHGNKIILLLGGLTLGSIYLNSNFKKEDYEVYPSSKYVYNVVYNKKPDIPNDTIVTTSSLDENNSADVIASDNVNNENIIINKRIANKVTTNQNSTVQNNIINDDNSEINNPIIQEKESEDLITVYRKNGSVLNISMNDYLIGVVAAEMPASFNSEALKAQSVVARTYTLKLIDSNRKITDDESTQAYKDNDELKVMWGNDYNMYYNKIKNAVLNTKNEVIKYEGKLIDAVYHSTSNGYTEDSYYVWSNNIPYLRSVPSSWDTSASSFLRTVDFSYDDIKNKLGIDFDEDSVIEIISRNESNRITSIRFNNHNYTGVELRNLLKLRSADFDILEIPNGIRFTTRGYGHGVGMSQYGANGMANSGYNYKQILNYYYTNVAIENS